MSKFWLAIAGLVFAVLAVLIAQAPTNYLDVPHPAIKPISAGVLVSAVWAILFRRQIEQRRISLLAMFILVTLLASWFAADQFFNPGR
jgi:chromate transport protein ChrA